MARMTSLEFAGVGHGAVESLLEQGGDFGFTEPVGDGDDLGGVEVVAGPDIAADVGGVDVLGHQVDQDHMGQKFLGDQSGVEAVFRDLDVVVLSVLELGGQAGGRGDIAVDDHDPGSAHFQGVGRDRVGLHESDQLPGGNPPVPGTGNAISLELAAVEPLGDGPRGHIADLSDLSGCQYIFAFIHGWSCIPKDIQSKIIHNSVGARIGPDPVSFLSSSASRSQITNGWAIFLKISTLFP